MVRLKVVLLLSVVIGLAGFLISLNGCGGTAATAARQDQPCRDHFSREPHARQLVPRSGSNQPGRRYCEHWSEFSKSDDHTDSRFAGNGL